MRLFRLVFVLSLMASIASSAFASGVVIYPLDQASIAVGARFDFKVEFPEKITDGDFEIFIGGKPAADVLGAAGKVIEETFGKPKTTASAFIARDCSLRSESEALSVEVLVRKDSVGKATWRVFAQKADGKVAKNVILMIGDGLSQAHRTAARIMSKGIRQGKYAGKLAMDDMPHMGLVGTSGVDSIITDSANSATAYTTGHKSSNGALCVYRDRTDSGNPADDLDDPAAETIAFLARRLGGKAVGVVSDAEIQDATPAAMYAHVATRSNYAAISEMLGRTNFDVILGGGRASFSPQTYASFKEQGYTVAETRTELLAASGSKKLFGCFNPKNIDGVMDRRMGNFTPASETDQPDLTEMATSALKVLDAAPNGFVLMIEGARIDKYSHSLDWERAVMDTIMFDKTVERVKEYAKRNAETLVLVLGDHTHGISIVGTKDDAGPHTMEVMEQETPGGEYVKKTVKKQGRDYVRTYNDAGFPNYVIDDGYPKSLAVSRRLAVFFTNFPDHYETHFPKLGGEFKPTTQLALSPKQTFSVANENYKGAPDAQLRIGNIPRGSNAGSVHSCEDSIVTAMGPGSEAVHGFMDNTAIFEIMVKAMNLGK